jgi:hypothetical protein
VNARGPESATSMERWSRFWRNQRQFDNVAILAAAVLFVASNVLASRFFWRWDGTSAQLFTLSEPTRATLARVDEPLDVVVLLSRSDPLARSVEALLEEYRAASTQIQIRFIDPDRNPAEFVAAQHSYGLLEGRTQDGRLASDASIVLARGTKHWFVTTDDIAAYDEQATVTQPRLEQVLTEGIARLVGQVRQEACFVRGNQELGAESAGPQGLGEFRHYLERNNTEIRVVDLGLAKVDGSLRGCDLAVLVGATKPYSAAADHELARWVKSGGALLLALGPLTDDDGRIIAPGLAELFAPLGIVPGNNAVFEGEPSLRMPVGIGGEVFLATPQAHAVTAGLVRGDQTTHRVLLQLAQSFELAPAGTAKPLLVTSESARALNTFRGLAEGTLGTDDATRRFVMATAGEYPAYEASAGDQHDRHGRLLAIGTPSVLWSSTWQEPSLVGTRRFVESAVGWLSADKPLVSVPEKPSQAAGLALSEDGMSEVREYVLLYLPLTMAAIGGLIVWGRRRESKTRDEKKDSERKDEAKP